MNKPVKPFNSVNNGSSSGINILRDLFAYIRENITKQGINGINDEAISPGKREFRVAVLRAQPGLPSRFIEENFTTGLWCKSLELGLNNWEDHVLRFGTETIVICRVVWAQVVSTDLEYIAEIDANVRIGAAFGNRIIRISWFKDNPAKKEETLTQEEVVKPALYTSSSPAFSVCVPTPRDAIFNQEQQERKAQRERELFEGKVNAAMQFIEDSLKIHKENPEDATKWLDVGSDTVFLVGKPSADILALLQNDSEVLAAVNERYRSVGWNYVGLHEDDTIVIC